ncbi:ShKT domain-containing protein [Aphelenchoides bicaudatus]|nr:ShKT domain-containing protein [Aphelenchoides bicaudatus]
MGQQRTGFFLFVRLFCTLGIVSAVLDSTRKFTVLRMRVQDRDQLQFLQSIYLNSTLYDFWKEPTQLEDTADIMVREPLLDDFKNQLNKHNLTYKTIIDDVQSLIQRRTNESLRRRPTHFDPSFRRVNFNLARYHSFADMINYLNGLAINYPDRVQVQPIGTTHEGRQIPLIKIGTRNGNTAKPAIWIDGGIHAREWVSPAAVLYFIDQLVTEYDTSPVIRQFVDQLDWFIAPLSFKLRPRNTFVEKKSVTFAVHSSQHRCFYSAKNSMLPRSRYVPNSDSRNPNVSDLNRNFDWFFGQVGSSTDPCSEIYAGTFAFSEPETRAIRDFVTSQSGRIKTFLTFHSYSQILMYPFGHALRTYPTDVDDLSSTAIRAAKALESMYGIKYTVGTDFCSGADTLYPASGGSEDWAKGRMGIKYSYLFELRPDENVWDGFLLAENQILPTSRETWEAVKTIAQQTLRFAGVRAASAVNLVVGQPKRECRDLDQLCEYWARNGACNGEYC